MPIREYGVSMSDVLGKMAYRDVVVIFPHEADLRAMWDDLHRAITEKHGGPDYVVRTQRAIVSRRTHTAVHGWLPDENIRPKAFTKGAVFVTTAHSLPSWIESMVSDYDATHSG